MTARQAKFVTEYLKDLNQRQAAIRAGFSTKCADQAAQRLLRIPKVRDAIAAGKTKQVTEADLDAKQVLAELALIAFVDLRDYFDAAGNLKPMSEWTPAMGKAMSSIEVVKKNLTAGDGQMDMVHKFKLWDKVKALDTLAKHFGLLIDKHEHGGEFILRWADDDE